MGTTSQAFPSGEGGPLAVRPVVDEDDPHTTDHKPTCLRVGLFDFLRSSPWPVHFFPSQPASHQIFQFTFPFVCVIMVSVEIATHPMMKSSSSTIRSLP